MARRSLPMFFCHDLEDGDPRMHFYNPAMNSFVHEPSLRLERRLQPVEQFPIQDVGFSYNLNHGFGRGRTFPHQVVVPGRRSGKFDELFNYDDAIVGVGDAIGYYSPYGSSSYRDNRLLVNGANLPVNRRLSTGPGYLVTEKHSMMEFREYTKEERHKINEKIESLCNKANPGEFEDMLNASGSCESCGISTTRFCQRCNSWYCSRECQLKDWPRHKMQCISIPELGDLSEETSSSVKETLLMKMKQKISPQKRENIEDDNGHNFTPKLSHPQFLEKQNEIDSKQHMAKSNHNYPLKLEEQNGNDNKHNYTTKTNRDFPQKYDELNENDRHYKAKGNRPQNYEKQGESLRQNYSTKFNKFNTNKPKHNFNRIGGSFAKENHKNESGHDTLQSVGWNNHDSNRKAATQSSRVPVEGKFDDSGDWNCEVSSSVSSEVKKTTNDVSFEVKKTTNDVSFEVKKTSNDVSFEEKTTSDVSSEVKKTTSDVSSEVKKTTSNVSSEVKKTTNSGCCQHGKPILMSPAEKPESVSTKHKVQEFPTLKSESIPSGNNKMENLDVSTSSEPKLSDVNKVSLKSVELAKDTFSKVKVTVLVGTMQCWVQLEDSKELLEVMSILNEDTGKSPLNKVEQGMLCAALYEGLWFRGKVTLLEPELKVLYIDYGNEECCTLDQLKPIPAAVEKIPALAIKIKLAEGTSKKYEVLSEDQVLSVKCVDVSEDVIIVQVEGEIYLEKKGKIPVDTNVPEKTSKINSTLSLRKPKEEHLSSKPNESISIIPAFLTVKIGKKGGCEFRQDFGEDNYGVTIVCPELREQFAKLFATLISLKGTTCSSDYKPCVGETIAVFVEGGSADGTGVWMRARVLAIDGNSYQVNMFDHCLVATVDIVRRLPQELAAIPEFGARCCIIDKLQPEVRKSLFEQRRFFFTVFDVNLEQKKVVCLLQSENDEGMCKAELSEWVPVLEEKIIPKYVSLKNKNKVVLTVFFNLNSLCLRSSQNDKILSKLEADLSCYCSSAAEVIDIPAKNEIVACKFLADGKYYRAQIVHVEKDQIKVFYIDYGNMDCVTKSSLKLLTTDLKEIPALVDKVGLKNIINNQMTKDTVDLLTRLTQNSEEMTIIISGPLEEGVELILPDGRNLNNEINKTMTPVTTKKLPEKESDEIKLLTESDIKYLELPVGKTVDFVVLHKMDSESLMGCEANGEVMAQVHGTMSEKMNMYCESTSEKSYIPKVSELCFAKFEDGLWYRAMCIGEDSAKENNILFLDFGNMAVVDSTNIRKMTPEYIQMPAVAVLCAVQVPAGMAAEAQKKQLDELVNVNQIYKAHIVSCDGLGSYVVEFPHVTEALKKLNK